MKIKNALVLLLLSFCLAKPTFSAPVTLIGVPDCGQWVNRKSEPDKGWLLGFMSGLNLKHVEKNGTDAIKPINSADQIFVWMTNYCQKNPMSSLSDAGSVLFDDLLMKAIFKETSSNRQKDQEGTNKK